jgi:uncharacterized delta-60 repeat protein
MFIRSVLIAAMLASTTAYAADGNVDTSFGIFSTGHNVISVDAGGTNTDTVAEVLTAPDGSLYLVGSSTQDIGRRITLVHLQANGQVDTNFGTNGRFIGPAATNDTLAAAAAFDGNGNILVAGSRSISGLNADFTVCKFRNAGTQVFSATNKACVTVAFDLGGSLKDVVRGMTVLQDGRIVLVGWANAAPNFDEAAIAVINPDGTPDAGFGTGGKQYFLHAQTRQDLLYSVVEYGSVLAIVGEAVSQDNYHAALYATVDKNTGAQDDYTPSFLNTVSGPAAFRRVITLRNGSLAGVGKVHTDNDEMQGMAVHFGAQGTIVTGGFGGADGVAMFDSGDGVELTRAIEQRDGKLLVAGTRTPTNVSATQLVVGRFDGSGSLDVVGFNPVAGYTAVDFQLPGAYDNSAALTLQGGLPVLAGSVEATGNADNNYDFGVARLKNDEIFGTGFGKNEEQ